MKISKEVKTALLVISSILLFIWGYWFLKGQDILSTDKTFYVVYDNVEGLPNSAPVTINGLVVGKVSSITLDNKTGRLTVAMQIKNKDFPISKSSTADIYEPGLIGGKQMKIVPNLADHNLAESGDYLKGQNVPGLTALVGEKLEPLQQKLERVMAAAEVLINNFNTVLDDKTKANLRGSIASLNATMSEMSSASKTLNSTLTANKGHIDATMKNLDKASGNFAVVSDSIAKIQLGKTVKKADMAMAKLNNIMTELNSGKGTAGKLLKDEALYTNLSKSTKELELLLQDLRLNPTRYINVSLFGKKNKPYVAPKATDTIKVKK